MDGLTLPEFAIRDLIEDAIEAMLATPALLDTMLAFRPAAERDSYRTALSKRQGKVRLGWGLEAIEDWLVTVALVNQTATHVIGDMTSDAAEVILGESTLDDTITAAVDQTIATPTVGGVPATLPERCAVRIGTGDTLEYVIGAVDGDTITLVERGIRETSPLPHAAGVSVAFYGSRSQRVGWSELETLRIDLLGTVPPFLMVLGRMLQAFLVLSRDAFEEQGFTLMDVTASDVQLRLPDLPTHIYQRTLNITVRTEMSLPDVLPVLTGTHVELSVEGVSGGQATQGQFYA